MGGLSAPGVSSAIHRAVPDRRPRRPHSGPVGCATHQNVACPAHPELEILFVFDLPILHFPPERDNLIRDGCVFATIVRKSRVRRHPVNTLLRWGGVLEIGLNQVDRRWRHVVPEEKAVVRRLLPNRACVM